MKSWIKLGLIGLAAVLAAEAWLRTRPAAAPAPAAAGAEAPDFDLPDLQGRRVRLADLRGRVVAVNFWATWCPPCREEIPDLAKVYAAHRGRCFELLGLAEESGGRADVAEAAQRLGVNYPVLVDPEGTAGDAFRIPGYPRTYLLDHEGRIRRTFEGAVERRELEAALEPLLAAAPATCPPRAAP